MSKRSFRLRAAESHLKRKYPGRVLAGKVIVLLCVLLPVVGVAIWCFMEGHPALAFCLLGGLAMFWISRKLKL